MVSFTLVDDVMRFNNAKLDGDIDVLFVLFEMW